jgi:hypothetical protein
MKNKLDDDLDSLFQVPLSEFVEARKSLAARLKQAGRTVDADRVKTVAKPAISVWTVNQLFWRYRDDFDELIAAGQQFRRAHTSRSGKPSELTGALNSRRDALNHLSELAETLLREAGHNPTLDMMRRIATTLEAMSAYAALPDGQAAGRLTKDLDPPGFESLAPFIRAVPTTRQPEPKTAPVSKKNQSPSTATKEAHRQKETRQSELAAAKIAVANAKKTLTEARARAQTLGAAQKKADAVVKDAEKQKREAEQRFKAASTTSTEAQVRAQNLAMEGARATQALSEAERAVAAAANELAALMRDRR